MLIGSLILHYSLFHCERTAYLLLCLFFLNLFLRLCVAILWPFFFLLFGIMIKF